MIAPRPFGRGLGFLLPFGGNCVEIFAVLASLGVRKTGLVTLLCGSPESILLISGDRSDDQTRVEFQREAMGIALASDLPCKRVAADLGTMAGCTLQVAMRPCFSGLK